jgi:hypothetical protein
MEGSGAMSLFFCTVGTIGGSIVLEFCEARARILVLSFLKPPSSLSRSQSYIFTVKLGHITTL